MEYFKFSELKCKCGCNQAKMDRAFLDSLNVLREAYGKPVIITSGYRCPKHNSNVSTTGPNGPHTTGMAVDVKCSGTDAYNLVMHAMRLGFTGIGVRQNGPHENRFIHLDMLEGNVRPWVWTY